jgi:hypothetical protein
MSERREKQTYIRMKEERKVQIKRKEEMWKSTCSFLISKNRGCGV